MNLKGQRVTVMGLGLFGGGVGAVRFLVREGAVVTVTDLRKKKDLRASVRALKGLPIAFKLGRHEETDFQNADLIVANPAVPRSSQYLKIAGFCGGAHPLGNRLIVRNLSRAHNWRNGQQW